MRYLFILRLIALLFWYKFNMTSIFRTMSSYWYYLFTEIGDERSNNWFFTSSPIPPSIILFAYYRFIKKVGPEFMKNRKPFNLDKIIQIYNLVQVFLCGWLAYEGFRLTYGGNYTWVCEPMDKSMSPLAVRIASLTWTYYMIKFFDLLDTVFFVLRKKFNQISFLHLYHHIGVTVLGYIATKYYPDGHGFLLIIINSFVHTFMYAYYFITNYNPGYKKNMWWKKYVTQMQIAQFLILTVHFGKVLFMTNCNYPLLPVLLFIPQNILITVLFMNFYRKTYLQQNKSIKTS